jgi:hypothetical protein
MSHMAPIAVEIELSAIDPSPPALIGTHHATEAARILLATSPRHARRFALAMHKRVSRSLDTDLIEHWSRVVMKLGRKPEANPVRILEPATTF